MIQFFIALIPALMILLIFRIAVRHLQQAFAETAVIITE
jgi:hypothetical protein